MAHDSPSRSSSLWKGKSRATESDFDDLNPIITYRQLHSHNLGIRGPLRVIALCDSDAFYAACEQVRLGIDPLKPLVVQQWDSLIAVNYPARKFGISRMDKIRDAKKRCPELVVVHVATYKEGDTEPGYWENPDTRTHKVSLDHYRRESMKIIQLFKEGLPDGEVEKASIDEAFIDFTRPVREEMFRRYPYLSNVPHDAPNGSDSPLPPPPPIAWNNLGTIIPVNPNPPPALDELPSNSEQATSVQFEDDSIDEDDGQTTWHDVALSIAAEMMDKIRGDIRTKLGYTTSAGIARNKFLAKLTASYKKPNSQSVLRNAAIPNYLKPMAFQKIRFLGGKLGKALAEEYDVSTVGDLLSVSLEEMQRKFGENSIWVYEILRGIDRSEVKEKSAVNKSMLASKNLSQPITKAADGHHWVRVLAAELALRLNEAREADPGLWPKSIVLHVRQGWESSRSKQSAFAFARNVTVDLIASAGDKLWRELVGPDTSKVPLKITSVQLSFSGIMSMETGQRSIEGFFTDRDSPRKQTVTATPSGQGGSAAAKRKRDSGEGSRQSKRGGAASDDDDVNALTLQPVLGRASSFRCTRCGKRVALSEAFDDMLPTDEIRRDALAVLKTEHDDFHFAQDLSKQLDGTNDNGVRPPRSDNKSTKKKRKKEKEGIEKFFSRKT